VPGKLDPSEAFGRHSPLLSSAVTSRVAVRGSNYGRVPAPNLEGRLRKWPGTEAHPAALICHANPKAGGHMDMKLLQAIEDALLARGVATLVYNSRGVGKSEGYISGLEDRRLVAPEGTPETLDAGAALAYLASLEGIDGDRLAIVGHSFGARVALAYLYLNSGATGVQGVACIGLPVAWRDLSHLGKWPRPKLFVTGERDDFCPPDKLEEYVATLPPPSTQVTLKGTGHFFEGREHDLGGVVGEFLLQVFSLG
jgi:alpha/beta superfamily hydrolase